jgi:hypothetical protein
VDDLIERTYLGGEIAYQLTQDRPLNGKALLLIQLEVGRDFAGVEGVNAFFDDWHGRRAPRVISCQ